MFIVKCFGMAITTLLGMVWAGSVIAIMHKSLLSELAQGNDKTLKMFERLAEDTNLSILKIEKGGQFSLARQVFAFFMALAFHTLALCIASTL